MNHDETEATDDANRRERVSTYALANHKKRRHVDGETVRNCFVAFKNAAETLQFFWEWSLAERAAAIEVVASVLTDASVSTDAPDAPRTRPWYSNAARTPTTSGANG